MDIKQVCSEMILDFILNHYDYKRINYPNDILTAVEYHEDAVEDIKDRLWEIIKYEINLSDILDEVDKKKELEQSEDEDEEDSEDEDDSEED
jgi:DNA-binding NtrC family response regulator